MRKNRCISLDGILIPTSMKQYLCWRRNSTKIRAFICRNVRFRNSSQPNGPERLSRIFYRDWCRCRAFFANTLIRSSGDLRLRSTAELLLSQKTKLPCLIDGLLMNTRHRLNGLSAAISNCQKSHAYIWQKSILWDRYNRCPL